jgi:hypothetical protein
LFRGPPSVAIIRFSALCRRGDKSMSTVFLLCFFERGDMWDCWRGVDVGVASWRGEDRAVARGEDVKTSLTVLLWFFARGDMEDCSRGEDMGGGEDMGVARGEDIED